MPSVVRVNTARDCTDVSLAFRVSCPSRDGVIEVLADGSVIQEEPHARLHPAEMVRAQLTRKQMAVLVEQRAAALEVRVK